MIGTLVHEPDDPDMGPDTVRVMAEVLFFIEKGIFLEALGSGLASRPLFDEGCITRRNGEPLAKLRLPEPKRNAGLDATQARLNGEKSFSIEPPFESQPPGTISTADLLGDSNCAVLGNPKLLEGFAPPEDLVSFGVGALFLVRKGGLRNPANRDDRVATVPVQEGAVRQSPSLLRWGARDKTNFLLELFFSLLLLASVCRHPPFLLVG